MILLQKLDEIIIKKAKDNLSQNYLNKLISDWKKIESIVWRYLIADMIYSKYWIKNYQIKFEWYNPIFENNIFRSISHIQDYVLVWISDTKIWLDLEYIKERDSSLLLKFSDIEYKNCNTDFDLWECKNWNNFYRIWTAKESFIKKLNLKLDDMEKIHFKEIFLNKNIDKYLIYSNKKIYFDHQFKLEYRWSSYTWYNVKIENMVLSLLA
jgi:hypothetical protein